MIEMSKTFEKFQLVFKFVLFFTLKLLFSIHEQYTLAKIWGRVGEGGLQPLSPPRACSITLLFFSHLQVHCFFSLIFLYTFDEYDFSPRQCRFCVWFQFQKDQAKINCLRSEIQKLIYHTYKLIHID